jgi:hypothetical protein
MILGAPTGLSATASGSYIYLSWGYVNNASSYRIYRSTYNGGYSYLTNISNTNYYDYDVYPDTPYYYKVSAVSFAGNEGPQSDYAGGPISNITYEYVSNGTWTLESDGRRKSPAIGNSITTKTRVNFTSNVSNASITIQLDVSSEAGYDYAFISTLDNPNATHDNGYYPNSCISGTNSTTVTITVPAPGLHFIDIGYRKDGSYTSGSDCAWFKVTQY